MYLKHLLTSHDLTAKRLLLRLDLDVPLKDGQVADDSRLKASLPTLKHCLQQAQSTLIIGHLGRPTGEDPKFSLKPALEYLKSALDQDISYIPTLERAGQWGSRTPLALLENLRYFEGEEKNDPNFARSLSQFADIYIHDAFASSHRHSASGIGVPRLLRSLLGLAFSHELTALDPIIQNPKRPITVILGGSKTDKLQIVDNLLTQVDHVLLGGSLPTSATATNKLIPATLNPDGLDITQASIDLFKSHIAAASTLVWNGPVGKYEDSLHGFHGTSQLAEAIATANAYKVAGGGDTLAVINKLGLQDRFDHLSLGGGAMLHYLAHHSLPVLDAILNSPTLP